MWLRIFVVAVGLRWLYAVVLFAAMSEAGLKGADSVGYLDLAHEFAAAIRVGGLRGFDWLGPNPSAMPLFTWLLALHGALAGAMAPLTYVLMQGLIDGGTCLLVYATARTVDQRYALPAAIAAIFNPTQIVMSGGGSATPAPGGAAQAAPRREAPKVGRNDPCPCGSGKKYKKCHGS